MMQIVQNNSTEVETLLPHRGPMLLISEIISMTSQGAVTHAVVSEHWPLTDATGANAVVLIELAAQTAGINNGWHLMQTEGPEADHRGWIVGIKQSRLFVQTLPLGTIIETQSKNTFEYDNLREIRGIARVGQKIVAEVTMQLMKAEDY
jgi:predicted hotdog family 3-hydroxylacyl-ACP dehydratase